MFVWCFFENIDNLNVVSHKEADYGKAHKEHYVTC